jgi:hypothetical protein
VCLWRGNSESSSVLHRQLHAHRFAECVWHALVDFIALLIPEWLSILLLDLFEFGISHVLLKWAILFLHVHHCHLDHLSVDEHFSVREPFSVVLPACFFLRDHLRYFDSVVYAVPLRFRDKLVNADYELLPQCFY